MSIINEFATVLRNWQINAMSLFKLMPLLFGYKHSWNFNLVVTIITHLVVATSLCLFTLKSKQGIIVTAMFWCSLLFEEEQLEIDLSSVFKVGRKECFLCSSGQSKKFKHKCDHLSTDTCLPKRLLIF